MGSVVSADSSLTLLKGVGPKLATTLARSGLRSLRDLLMFFPRRAVLVRDLDIPRDDAVGELVRLSGRVQDTRLTWLRGRRSMVTVRFVATDGSRFETRFFNQPYLKNSYETGSTRLVEGVLDLRGGTFQLKNARIRRPDPETAQGPCEVRYADLEGISEERLRRLVHQALDLVNPISMELEALPQGFELEAPAASFEAVRTMHQPSSIAEHEAARRYFALLEAMAVFRQVEAARRRRQAATGPQILVSSQVQERILGRIPFQLTADQQRAVERLLQYLAGPAPMGALLQGDVGTGKTAVAVAAALAAVAEGWQVAFLAPTELLAEQHHAGIRRWLLGSQVAVELLTANIAVGARRDLEQRLADGRPCLVLGTHALLSESTLFQRLGLVVVDEQHRFGVRQRMTLVRKGHNPHVLFMTATPIPRTLTFTLFGDLDVELLKDKPPGRRTVATGFVEPRRWRRVLKLIAQHVRRGEQVFVVCPKIGEDGEKGGAVLLAEELGRRFGGRTACGLVHGQMRPQERQAATEAFRSGELSILVGTTVLEVGVDVPAATLMVIVGADRFGLATLHQLRGRVGRGQRRSLCILTGKDTPRVRAVCRTTDGFELAEEDLRLRGAGELLGTRQSGLSDLRVLDPIHDLELLARARQAVRSESS